MQLRKGVNLPPRNATLPCPEPYLTYASEVDFYWWGSDNLTQLCTPGCTDALSSWTSSVIQSCGQQNVLLDGSYVKAHTLPLMYSHGHDIACLTSDSGDFCMIERQGWQGQEAVSYAGDYCLYDDPTEDMPECEDPDFDPNVETPDMTRMANIYPQDLVSTPSERHWPVKLLITCSTKLCSDCFLKTFHIRLQSPFLPLVNYTNYLLDQWEDMQSVCGTTIPMTTSSSTLYVGPATATATGLVSTSVPSTTVPSAPASTTCAGQLANTADNDGIPYGCSELAKNYSVSTGAAMFASNDNLCDVDTQVCLPLPCSIDQIGFTETCTTLVEKYYTEANNLTLALFLSWNPALAGFCQRPLGSQYVCTGPPGGTVTLGSPVYNPTGTTGYYTTAIPPQPTSTGTTGSCGLYYSVEAGDICQTICLRYGISFDQFRAMNTQILPDCSNLWLGYAVSTFSKHLPHLLYL